MSTNQYNKEVANEVICRLTEEALSFPFPYWSTIWKGDSKLVGYGKDFAGCNVLAMDWLDWTCLIF